MSRPGPADDGPLVAALLGLSENMALLVGVQGQILCALRELAERLDAIEGDGPHFDLGPPTAGYPLDN